MKRPQDNIGEADVRLEEGSTDKGNNTIERTEGQVRTVLAPILSGTPGVDYQDRTHARDLDPVGSWDMVAMRPEDADPTVPGVVQKAIEAAEGTVKPPRGLTEEEATSKARALEAETQHFTGSPRGTARPDEPRGTGKGVFVYPG